MNALMQRLGLSRPLVLAPMAGGVSTPELVAAVSNAGGLGSLGAAYLSAEQIVTEVQATRQLTLGPFAVNLFVPAEVPGVNADAVALATAELSPFHAELNLPPPILPERVQEDFERQFEAVLALRPAVFSFAFGRLEGRHLKALQERGILTIGTATSAHEAAILEADGVDAVVVQGGEAGGHRGGWERDDVGDTLALVRDTVKAVRIPVLAAGGLMTREDVQAVLEAGASLVQCGTAFLLAPEAGTSGPYREALAGTAPTTLTRNFSGRLARGIENRVTAELQCALPYPLQNSLTRPMRVAAARAGRAEFLSLWAGTGYHAARDAPAAQIVAWLCPAPESTSPPGP